MTVTRAQRQALRRRDQMKAQGLEREISGETQVLIKEYVSSQISSANQREDFFGALIMGTGVFGVALGIILLPLLAGWGMFKAGRKISSASGCLPALGWILLTGMCFVVMIGSGVLYFSIVAPMLIAL